MKNTLTVSWFSAGVSSAVATWLVRDQLDKIIYTHIDDQHPDTMRFVKDCEAWFGKSVEILQSPYRTVAAAVKVYGFISYREAAAVVMAGVHDPFPEGSYVKQRLPVLLVQGNLDVGYHHSLSSFPAFEKVAKEFGLKPGGTGQA